MATYKVWGRALLRTQDPVLPLKPSHPTLGSLPGAPGRASWPRPCHLPLHSQCQQLLSMEQDLDTHLQNEHCRQGPPEDSPGSPAVPTLSRTQNFKTELPFSAKTLLYPGFPFPAMPTPHSRASDTCLRIRHPWDHISLNISLDV